MNGVDIMRCVKVRFDTMDQVTRFVNAAEEYPSAIDLHCEKLIVDGKSFLGILNYGLKKDLKMCINHDNCDNFLEKVNFVLLDKNV